MTGIWTKPHIHRNVYFSRIKTNIPALAANVWYAKEYSKDKKKKKKIVNPQNPKQNRASLTRPSQNTHTHKTLSCPLANV